MNLRQRTALALAMLSTCILSSHSSPAEELFSVHLNWATEGEFPVQSWFPEDRLSIDDEMQWMHGVVNELAKLKQSEMLELKRAFADRAVFVRNLEVANLRTRIDEVCESHRSIIEKLQGGHWADASKELVAFDIAERRYQVQSLAYLVSLYAVRELSEGRVESASQTLAGGFAFAHNLRLTSGDLNLIMGTVLQSVMTYGIADMQSMEVPDMRPMFSRLVDSQMDQETIDRVLWNDVCRSMPVLIDRPRNPSEWRDDVQATLETFHQAKLTPESEDEAEKFGRQLQTMVQGGKRVAALSIPVRFKHGAVAETKDLRPGQSVRLTLQKNIVVLAGYVEDRLDVTSFDQAHHELQQRLCGLQCVELLRVESTKRGRWLSSFDEPFRNAIPAQLGTSLQPAVVVLQGTSEWPSYEIRLPAKNFLAGFFLSPHETKTVSVGIEQE